MLQQLQQQQQGGGGRFELTGPPSPAPARYAQNPLASGDVEECFVHFHELVLSLSSTSNADAFTLYDFFWKDGKDETTAAAKNYKGDDGDGIAAAI